MDLPDLANVDYSDPMALFRAIGAGQPGGLPMPKLTSPEEVRREVSTRTSNIIKNFNFLKAVLERHEATIQKRWMKKNKEQKRKIILDAWKKPMSSSHRPDFEAFRKENVSKREAGTQYRDNYLWPYINQEDLCQPRTLLMLLNARGRTHPAEFAAADGEAMHMGLVSKAIVPLFLNEYVMMFNGRYNENNYGELIAWNDNPNAFDWLMSRRGSQPGEGLLILESQDQLLNFLVSCVEHILHEIPKTSLLEYPIQEAVPTPASAPTGNDTGFESLAIMRMETPYRPPARLDFARIESLLTARRDAAADHIWSLREDPLYFSNAMRECREHRQEMLKDSNGKPHPLFSSSREEILWIRVIGNEVSSAYLSHELWTELHKQSAELKIMKDKFANRINPSKDLPEKYMDAILKFRFYLEQTAKGPMSLLKVACAASPPMRAWFARKPERDPTETRILVSSKPGIKLETIERYLIWLLETLWEDGTNLYFAKLTNIMDELQRLIDSNAQAKSMISAYVAAIISDLSIISECIRQLDIYQPWANTYEHYMTEKEDGIKASYAQRSQSWAIILNALKGSEKELGRLGTPDERRFFYPVANRRSKENVEAMRTAEANLDQFWRKVDMAMQQSAGANTDLALHQLLSKPRLLERTPEWVEVEKENSKGSLAPANVETLYKPLSELYLDLGHRDERKPKGREALQPKIKPKTKGLPALHPTPNDMEQPTNENLSDPQPHFELDHRALKVFKTLFYTPSVTATPGQVPWNDFLHAMASTGFTSEKLYGSVWQFKPTALDVERSILFHEPHPVGKLSFYVARRYGRRLNRAYGWHGGMFALAEAK